MLELVGIVEQATTLRVGVAVVVDLVGDLGVSGLTGTTSFLAGVARTVGDVPSEAGVLEEIVARVTGGTDLRSIGDFIFIEITTLNLSGDAHFINENEADIAVVTFRGIDGFEAMR